MVVSVDTLTMKPLLVTLEYPPQVGGVAHYYEHLVKYFPEDLAVLTLPLVSATEQAQEQAQEPARGKLIRQPLINNKWFILKWLPSIKYILNEARQQEADYFLVGQILPLGLPVWLAAKFLNKPYSVFLHGYDYALTRQNWRKRRVADFVIRHADKIICANNHTADLVKRDNLSAVWPKVKVVNPGVDDGVWAYDQAALDSLRLRYHLTGKKIVLTVGRLVKRKGADLVINVWPEVSRSQPDAVYVIIGQGAEKANLRALIKEKNLEQAVLLLTKVDDEGKKQWLQLADIFIMATRDDPTDFEGFGIVYLEAGLAAKPVIAARAGGVADAVVDNVTGLLVDSSKSEEISGAIVKLLAYPNLAQRLGEAGRWRARRDFAWDQQARKVYDLLKAKG